MRSTVSSATQSVASAAPIDGTSSRNAEDAMSASSASPTDWSWPGRSTSPSENISSSSSGASVAAPTRGGGPARLSGPPPGAGRYRVDPSTASTSGGGCPADSAPRCAPPAAPAARPGAGCAATSAPRPARPRSGAAPHGLRIVLRGAPAPHLRSDVDELAAHPAPATIRARQRDQPERDEPLIPVRMARDDDSPVARGERLARGQHPIQQRLQLLPGDLRVDLPNRTANDPRPIPEERAGGPIRADHHMLLAMKTNTPAGSSATARAKATGSIVVTSAIISLASSSDNAAPV